ncbi:hypothetical protein AVEN_172797-1 [Araneus ventricosus]|uniref:Uncharacterized protein n=1 Tax=Araneus ventricosus TaxID=182803 RepID=A0A4Y2BKW9_ARAVE|nr:hypothetical protein AVEN_172797-1 [Araneus ventricosus]
MQKLPSLCKLLDTALQPLTIGFRNFFSSLQPRSHSVLLLGPLKMHLTSLLENRTQDAGHQWLTANEKTFISQRYTILCAAKVDDYVEK